MLLLPKQRVRRYQIVLFIVLTTTLSSMFFLLISLPQTLQAVRFPSPTTSSELSESKFFANSIKLTNPLTTIISSLILIIGLLVLIESLFLWVPSLTDLTKFKGKMVWTWRRNIFPERIFSLIDAEKSIVIRRKRSSFLGWIMREFTMETHLPPRYQNVKQITDFTGIEKIINTPTSRILVKTVKLEQIPLQIIQMRSILSLMKPSPIVIREMR
ncbi:MAG: hypothetical protein ACFFFH_03990 [Candidatus Thorarchaeota archaeon]